MKKNRSILRKCTAILAVVVSAAFIFEACAKEPSPFDGGGNITMTTKATKVELAVAGTGDIVINWGDGKKSNVNDAIEYDKDIDGFWFTHDYSGTNLRHIAITGNITKLFCSNNELTALDVSGSPGLTVLNCGFNQLTGLDVSGSPGLTELSCDFNRLTDFDVSKNTALIDFMISNNRLTGLDVSKNTALTRFHCSNNRLKSLNFSTANIALGILDCSNNELATSVLNDLFRALPDRTKTDGYYENPELYVGFIRMGYNPGAGDCDSSIATKKGWRFRYR